ncbi:hypothetical protein Vretimale_1017 [Volvox reticuliferus]|uniref:Trimethylguanosine synthase n=1 Tax=Volvox reticuliferus TaxID=1737510 RepID=A0A8J4FRJ6_9CHLO|nr:hypothetical protein Vretifemale_10541 [Volvox reticuliferus]GIL94863.1 hypothetical protein Vretimale_1017 [Volvox reticuliferus]
MARQVLIEKWNSAQEVRLSTALDLDLSDTTVYRLGRLVITSVRLHDVGLVGGKEPVNVASEAPSDTEASSLSVELASLGLPTAFGKKGSGRREGRRTPGGSLPSSRLAHKGERQSGSRKVSLGGAHDSSDAADSHTSTAWLQGFDEQWGCHYYYNTKTQESVWEAPAEGFLPWEEAAGVADGTDAAQEDVAEPFQPLQLTPDSGAGGAVLTGTGACCMTGAERDAATAAAAPPEGATEPRGPGPAPRMLTEEDLLREMGLWQDREGVQGDGGIRSQTAIAAVSAPPPAVVRSMGAGVGAANERFGAGAGAGVLPQSSAAGTAVGGNCLGAGLLVNLLLRTSASQQQPSSTSMASTPPVVPPTALSEEQLLARLSLSTSPLTPMPPPPAAPAPPPPSPPPPSAVAVADTDSVSGTVAPAASSDAPPAAKAPPRMLTEEDILRSMGLLPGSPELGGDQTAANEPRPASSSAPAPARPPGPKPRPPPPPPGFSPAQGPAPMPGHDDSHKACDFEGLQPPPLPQQSQLHEGDRPPPYPVRLQSNQECHPHAGHQAVQFNPGAQPGSGASPRVHLPGGPHSIGPHPQSLYGHNMSQPPHRHPHLHGAPGEFHIPGLPQPLPFNHGSAAGISHMGFRPSPPPPPPGFGHPPPFLPPPVDMWSHPGGPYCPPLMPVMPSPPTSPPPPGFHLPPAVPGMSYGPLPYPYAGHPYPLYGMPPYGMPPGHPAAPPLPPPFAIGGYPPGPAPQPSGAGMAMNGGLALPHHHHGPQFQSASHHHHHGPDPKGQQQEPEQHLNHRNEQQQQQRLPSKSPACVDADIAGSGQSGAEKGTDINRRTVTWTLEELERQFEIMVATVTAAEDDVPAMATSAKQRQEAREGAAEDRQRRQKVGKDKALAAAQQQQHVGRHPGAAAGGRRTGTGRSTGGTTEASSADNDDDSAFYDTFVNGAATATAAAMAGTAAHIYQRLGTVAKPRVAEDDGTRRVALDPSTAAFVRTLLPRNAAKYWMQRYSLFSRFDSAIRLDTEGWWSVTPEVLAVHQAERSKEMCARGLVAIDACCGCGGNLIQMAGFFPVVLGVEISPKRVEMARHNAGVYGVEHKCQFLCADFFKVAAGLKVDSLFMSPPWGGPKYQHVNTFDVFFPLVGFNKSLLRLLDVTLNCVREQDGVVVAFLPRNTDLQQLAAVVPEHAVWEVERAYVNNKLKGITLYCHPGCTPDEPNVRMEAEAEYSLQGPAQVEVANTAV